MPQVKRLATNIYRASRGIQDMLQQLLNVSPGRNGVAEVCVVRDVVTAAWSGIEAHADARKVTLISDVPETLECPMERARMERVFLNLFENAVEVMRGGGSVHLRAHSDESSILIIVNDTGPGIRPEVRGRLFQPFVTFGKKNGLGLGLALSRQTLLDHGGDLWVNGDGPGAEFQMRLPKERRESRDTGDVGRLPAAITGSGQR